MFIAIIIIILGACVSILGSIYYNIMAIQRNYGTVNAYYGAYYGAMSAMERGLLMSKIKYPTYLGSGGFKGNYVYGANSEIFSGEFRKLNQGNNSITRNVNSRTNHIAGTIDTKTIRTISFYQYSDTENNSYTGGINIGSKGISSDELSFSGYTEPSRGGRDISSNTKGNVDFNRFFGLNNSDYTLRGLLTTNYSDYREKDAPLSGNFQFDYNATNPWPALYGQHQQQ